MAFRWVTRRTGRLVFCKVKCLKRMNISVVEVGGCGSPQGNITLVEDCQGCSWQSMVMAEACLHGHKLDQDAISIYPYNGPSVTLFPILQGGPMIWISELLVLILPACVTHPLKCNRNSCCRPSVDKQNRGWSYIHPGWRATNQSVSVTKQRL